MHLFHNQTEGRLRAGWRILIIQLSLFLSVGLSSALLPLSSQLSAIYSFIVIFTIIAFVGTSIDQRNFSEYGFSLQKSSWKEFIVGFWMAGMIMGLLFAISFALGWTQIEATLFKSSSIRFWGNHIYYLLFMVCVGFYEELWSRGYLLLNLTEGFSFKTFNNPYADTSHKTSESLQDQNFFKKYGSAAVLTAIFVSSTIFSLLHAGNPNVSINALINILLAGLMLAIPFVLTGRLWLSAGIHTGWNYFQGAVIGWSVSGTQAKGKLLLLDQRTEFDWLHGGSFGPEGGLLGTFGICLLIGWVLIWSRRRRDLPRAEMPS